jgi:hypothetical protein
MANIDSGDSTDKEEVKRVANIDSGDSTDKEEVKRVEP